MINNENNINETTVADTPKKRRKKSLYKAQLRMLVILGVLIVLLGVGIGLTAYFFSDADGVIDTFTESKTDKEHGKRTAYPILVPGPQARDLCNMIREFITVMDRKKYQKQLNEERAVPLKDRKFY